MVGSIDINGIIQEAKAQGVVNAGDFVRFLTDYSETDEIKDTAISTTTMSGRIISAVALDKNKVFIAHSSSSVETMNYLYGVVCIISKNTVSVGNDVKISTYQNSGSVISAVALNDSKVFIAHLGGSSSVLTSMVCTINGTSISVGVQAQLSGTANSGKVISAVKLDEGRVFIAHSRESNKYLYGLVCTISGTSISKGTDTLLVTQNTGSAQGCSAIALSNNKVFISHCHDSNYQLYGIVCEISGTAIVKGNDTQLSSVNYSGYYTCSIALNENKVIIFHGADSAYSLKAIVCTISGTSISKGTNTVLSSSANTGKVISVVVLTENKINVLHRNSNNYLYSMFCDISVTKKSDIQLSSVENSGSTISAVALSENNIFIGHSYGADNYLYGMVLGYLANLVKTITSSTEEISGIAITSGQAGEMVQVKKPNV